MKSPYNVRHWSPVKRVPKSYDPYWNVTEWEEIHDEPLMLGENNNGEPVYAGEGILAQIKEPSYLPVLTVEWLYETTGKEWWPLLDMMFADRKDLQERIKKIKGGE